MAISLACSKGLTLCRTETGASLKRILDDNSDFELINRDVLYCESMRGVKRSEYNRVWMRLADPTNKDQGYRYTLIGSLACADSKSLLRDYLNTALDSTNDKFFAHNVLEQFVILSSVYSRSQVGLELSIGFVRKNIDEVYRKFENALTGILGGMADYVNSKGVRNEVNLELSALDIVYI